jgi:hypothetical protein
MRRTRAEHRVAATFALRATRAADAAARAPGATGFGRYSPLGGAGEAGVQVVRASHLPTRVVPSSSIDRACQGGSKSGLRIK